MSPEDCRFRRVRIVCDQRQCCRYTSAFSGSRRQFQFTPKQGGPFHHSGQTHAVNGFGYGFDVKPPAVVLNPNIHRVASVPKRDAGVPRLGVAGDVRQRLLHDPVHGRLDLLGQPWGLALVLEIHPDAGLPAVAVHKPQQRWQKAQVVQHCRPQGQRQLADSGHQLVHETLRLIESLWLPLRVAMEHFQAQLYPGQGLAYLVVKFAGNVAPLLLLHVHNLPRQPLQPLVAAAQFGVQPRILHRERHACILRELRDAGARIRLLPDGAEAAAHPLALRSLIVSGQEIGNHSSRHGRLIFVSTATVRRELEAADAVIREAGFAGRITFRPPQARKLLSLPWVLWRDRRTTVMWDLAPDSPSPAGDAAAMARDVADRVRPGSIIQLRPWHPGNVATREALPLILSELRARGYGFVTVSELLDLR